MQNPSEGPSPIQVPSRVLGIGTAAACDNISGFDFAWLVMQLQRYGKQQFGDHFVIRNEDHEIIRRLLVYFLADTTQAPRLGIDLSKGILLTGPIGCGKTSLMRLMRLVPKPDRGFTLKSTRDVSFEFIQDGYEVIHRYSRLSYTHSGVFTNTLVG